MTGARTVRVAIVAFSFAVVLTIAMVEHCLASKRGRVTEVVVTNY